MSEGKHLVTEKRIGVIMGGSSSEREVSLNSGRPVAKALSDRGYTVIPLEITNETLYRRLLEEKVDVAFLALHGGAGENGAVQGLLEVMGIPYTGSGILASALAMDKVMSKRVFEAAGLKVAACTVFEGSGIPNYHEIASRLGTPVVVKPAAEGSSIGVSIVRSEEQFREAFQEARKYGPRVILETFVVGKEVHIGVLRDKAIGGVEVRPKGDFYDYRCKYTSGMTDYILPPEIEPDVYERVKREAEKAHQALGCRVYSRVDFLVDGSGAPWALEVNTLPGMTPTSLLPKIARSAGIEFVELLEIILEESVKRQEER